MPVLSVLRTWLCLLPVTSGANLLVSHFSGQVYSLNLTTDGTTGSLTVKSSISGCGRMPTWLTLDSASKTVYCFDESGGGGAVVSSFSVTADGTLKQTGQATTTGGDVHGSVYGGANGNSFIVAAEYDPSTISTYKLPLSSSTKVSQKIKFTMSGPGPVPSRQNAPHPHSAITDPTGKFLLVPDLGADLVRIFSIDATTGQITSCANAASGPGDGPRHGAFWTPKAGSTDGTILYTVNELGNSVSAWQVTYPSGSGGCLSLKRTQTLTTMPTGKSPPAGSKASEVHVSGDFLVAANRNDQSFGSQQDSLSTYTINPTTGAITYLESVNSHGFYPRSFVINKAGTLVAVGGQTSANVAILSRDVTTGKIGGLVANVKVGNAGTNGGEDGLSSVIWNE